MTHTQHDQLKEIAEKLRAAATLKMNCDYQTIREYWTRAIWHTRYQNQLLKEEEPREPVTFIDIFDEEEGGYKKFNILAGRNFNRVQWFKLLLGSNFYLLSKQQLKEVIAN
jgi:hypothetical protein